MLELVAMPTDDERSTLTPVATGGLAFRGPFLLLFALGQQVRALLDHTFGSAPLRPDEFAVYSALRLTGETTPAALAGELGMGRPTLSNWLRRMQAAGHLTRRPNPADGRSSLVALTPEAVRLTEACFPAFSLAIDTFLRHLDDQPALLAHMESASAALTAAIDELAVEDLARGA
jgi:DNA-binding MarR family transcriptional regulator